MKNCKEFAHSTPGVWPIYMADALSSIDRFISLNIRLCWKYYIEYPARHSYKSCKIRNALDVDRKFSMFKSLCVFWVQWMHWMYISNTAGALVVVTVKGVWSITSKLERWSNFWYDAMVFKNSRPIVCDGQRSHPLILPIYLVYLSVWWSETTMPDGNIFFMAKVGF